MAEAVAKKGMTMVSFCNILGVILLVGSFVFCGALSAAGATFLKDFMHSVADQIFRDHLPFMIGGVMFGSGLLLVSGATRWLRRLSAIVLVLGLAYPVIIDLLYLSREHLGESYAYLILGGLIAIVLGVIAGVIFIIWLVLLVITAKKGLRELRKRRRKSGAEGVGK